MNAEILLDQKECQFAYCASAMLWREGKLLLQRYAGSAVCSLPGGRVAMGSFSQETLAEKLREATGAAVAVERLCFAVERLYQRHKPCHQLDFIYAARLKNEDALSGVPFKAYDELGQEREGVEFFWAEPKDFDRLEISPACIKPYLKELPDHILHLREG